MNHALRCLLIGWCPLLTLSGCVEQTLTVRTNPSEAQVYLNGEPVGNSPTTVPFQWYGDYDVRITKDGYETLRTHRRLEAPWYDTFPFDFIVGVLWPGWVCDHTEWHFDLTPRGSLDRQALIERALQREVQLHELDEAGVRPAQPAAPRP